MCHNLWQVRFILRGSPEEFGPRALGHRSLLAVPDSEDGRARQREYRVAAHQSLRQCPGNGRTDMPFRQSFTHTRWGEGRRQSWQEMRDRMNRLKARVLAAAKGQSELCAVTLYRNSGRGAWYRPVAPMVADEADFIRKPPNPAPQNAKEVV